MRELAIYGAGGFGREVALMVSQINQREAVWNLVGFFDDGRQKGTAVDGLPVLGDVGDLNRWNRPLSLIIAIADGAAREKVFTSIERQSVSFPTLVHPQALTGSPRNQFGKGTIVTAGCILTTGITLGDFVIVNLSCTIGHDVRIGDYSSIMPGCNISGAVTIGKRTLIGTGAQILQGITIGDDCRIGAGAVVTRDVESGATVVGVPAR